MTSWTPTRSRASPRWSFAPDPSRRSSTTSSPSLSRFRRGPRSSEAHPHGHRPAPRDRAQALTGPRWRLLKPQAALEAVERGKWFRACSASPVVPVAENGRQAILHGISAGGGWAGGSLFTVTGLLAGIVVKRRRSQFATGLHLAPPPTHPRIDAEACFCGD